MKRASTTFLLVAVTSALTCLSACGYECGDSDELREQVRPLEVGLLPIEGEEKTYLATKEGGVLRVDLIVDDVVEQYAQAAPLGVRVARLVSDVLVPNAYADCAPLAAYAKVTFTVVWTPTGGDPETLHESVSANALYQRGSSTSGRTSLYVGGVVSMYLTSESGDARALELSSFEDRDNPEANIFSE